MSKGNGMIGNGVDFLDMGYNYEAYIISKYIHADDVGLPPGLGRVHVIWNSNHDRVVTKGCANHAPHWD